MKRNKILSFVTFLNVVLICFSCSECEEKEYGLESESPIEQRFNMSKASTIGHNVMLENMYEALKKNPVKVKGHLINNEKELDAYINLFIDANKEAFGITTRGGNNVIADFAYLKKTVVRNLAFRDISNQTRAVEKIETPDYLIMFYNEFFKSEELEINKLNEEILSDINKVMNAYPNLTVEEIDGLSFVAGVTYNSCIYWYENADEWVYLLDPSVSNSRRGYGWIWDGVKNGAKKWAKADSSGAIEAWAMNKVAGVASSGMTVLTGAAVGSAIGAWENLPVWD